MKRAAAELLALIILMGAMAYVVLQRLELPDVVTITSSSVQAAPAEAVEPAVTEEIPEATPEPTPTPEPEYFTFSAIGDLTLASHQYLGNDSSYSFYSRMNGDYGYPFANTKQYLENDEYTLANLECCFSDKQLFSYQTFYFRSPSDWANILPAGGVDFVTTANNHMMDFGTEGAESTYAALDAISFPYGKEGESTVVVTPNGIKLGIYCDYNNYQPDEDKCRAEIEQLKNSGVDYIICMFHWGQEVHYRPNADQQSLAHACIDAGADLIYGSHTHCLQPIEEYNGGIILYSMGNYSFGGNTDPKDWDTAIVQLSIKRDIDGTVSNNGYSVIPCCCSNDKSVNDYQPTPYEEGSEAYARVMAKLDGSFEGADVNVDYSSWYASHP